MFPESPIPNHPGLLSRQGCKDDHPRTRAIILDISKPLDDGLGWREQRTERHADHPRSILACLEMRLEKPLETRLEKPLETRLEKPLETRLETRLEVRK